MESREFTPAAVRKATTFTLAFGAIGATVAITSDTPSNILLPSVLLFVLILFNTFFSVRLFATLQSADDPLQYVIDILLGFLYLWMTLSLGREFMFFCSVAVMFAVATGKYVFLRKTVPHTQLLRQKIIIDVLGAASAVAALLLAMIWRADAALWLWLLCFALVQIDIFFLHPLYVRHRHRTS